MSTPMPASPFLSASDGLHPLSSVAVAPLAPPALGATAEISSAESLSAGPAVVAGLSPGSVTTAGTNSAATDCINEIFTFARGLMRDYQPDFQALLNEIAPFPMEYLPDYRLGDDDQPLFLQGAVA